MMMTCDFGGNTYPPDTTKVRPEYFILDDGDESDEIKPEQLGSYSHVMCPAKGIVVSSVNLS
jgi:hypothetical protein